ncbi:MAG TPA: class I SAM-dependent methyltransferase [Puia sp.]|nr:class I SAM-dependent methyltransferase [Puia sp.]
MTANLMHETFRQPAGKLGKLAGCLMSAKNKQRSDWTVEQLNIQPYQHILEVGYGPGNTLQEVARKLKVGFLAGIDHSLVMYQQAYKRNKRFIEQQLLQLHIGDLNELSYPPHYFHTIYGSNVHFFWKEPQLEFIRLSNMLRTGGKLIMVFQPRWADKEEAVLQAAEKIKSEYASAGLSNISIEYRDVHPVTCISATGFKA